MLAFFEDCSTTVNVTHQQKKRRNCLGIFDSISLTSGDGGDLGHYCTEIITLGLRASVDCEQRTPQLHPHDMRGEDPNQASRTMTPEA